MAKVLIALKYERYFVDTTVLRLLLLFTQDQDLIIMDDWNPNLTTVITIKTLLSRFVCRVCSNLGRYCSLGYLVFFKFGDSIKYGNLAV